jgi:ketosteroid isomerase-like protein
MKRSVGRIVIAFLTVAFVGTAVAQKPHKSGSFHAFLAKVDAAQLELQNGKAAAFKDLWSRSPDITLSGGFGGAVEKGWPDISKRLDWVAGQFSNGTHTNTRIVERSSGSLGYVVQTEQIEFKVPGQSAPSTRSYRVTMIFRKEAGQWKIVHRQADSNLTKQTPS